MEAGWKRDGSGVEAEWMRHGASTGRSFPSDKLCAIADGDPVPREWPWDSPAVHSVQMLPHIRTCIALDRSGSGVAIDLHPPQHQVSLKPGFESDDKDEQETTGARSNHAFIAQSAFFRTDFRRNRTASSGGFARNNRCLSCLCAVLSFCVRSWSEFRLILLCRGNTLGTLFRRQSIRFLPLLVPTAFTAIRYAGNHRR